MEVLGGGAVSYEQGTSGVGVLVERFGGISLGSGAWWFGCRARVWGLRFGVQDLGFRVQGPGLKVQGFGFRVQSLIQ